MCLKGKKLYWLPDKLIFAFTRTKAIFLNFLDCAAY